MIKVFGAAPSRALRVIWMLEEMGLPYERRPVDFAGRLSDEGFMAASPAGLLPAIQDGDVVLAESCAIMEYLGARHGPTPLTPTSDAANYPLYLQFLHFGEASLAGPLNLLVATRFMAPPEEKQNWGARTTGDMVVARSAMVDKQLAKTPYLAGDQFTAADISVGYALGLGRLLGLGERLSPAIVDYLNRLTERPAYKRAAAPA